MGAIAKRPTIPLCFGGTWCFNMAWAMVGYIFYSQMSESNDICRGMVLGWSVIQTFEVVVMFFMIGYMFAIPNN